MDRGSQTRSGAAVTAWSHSFLAELPDELRDVLLREAVAISIPAGGVIYRPYGPARIALLHRGQAREKVLSAQGCAADVRYVRAGDVIGLPAVIAGGANHSAEALTDCEATVFNVTTLLHGDSQRSSSKPLNYSPTTCSTPLNSA
jgi:CRP/FNR family transcriptional regulator, cyclic AMP receptor protein